MALFKLAAAAAAVVTVLDCFIDLSIVNGDAMQPALNPPHSSWRDVVLVDRWAGQNFRVSRGDVVILESPFEANHFFIKRITALEGDFIVKKPTKTIMRVPPGYCWVEADNPNISFDNSRQFGLVPLGLISGRAMFIIWPPSRIGFVHERSQ